MMAVQHERGGGARRGSARVALLGSVLTLAIGLCGPPAADAAPGSISGTVRLGSANGPPVPNAEVDVYDANGSAVTSQTTGSDGSYSVANLASGNYAVGFTAGTSGADVVAQFYNGKPTLTAADDVGVLDNQVTANVNANLARGSDIKGTVTDGAGAPLAGISVTAYDASDNFVANATTLGDGTYDLGGLAAGPYRVGFSDGQGNHLTRYYRSSSTLDRGDFVDLAAASTHSGVDIVLPTGGRIAGTLKDTSGSAVTAATILLYASDGRELNSTRPDGTGRYAFGGLETGTYEVEIRPDGGDPHVGQFFNGKSTLRAADPISVTAGQTATADPVLAIGGQVGGKVTHGGAPVGNAAVSLYDAHGLAIAQTNTSGADGSYSFAGVAPGSYEVGFATGASGLDLAPQFYRGKPSLAQADAVLVTAGAATPGIDADLAAGGSISGTATSDGSTGLSGIAVDVFDSFGNDVGQATTDAHGNYSLTSLATGAYEVEFSDPNGARLTRFYKDASSLQDAGPVPVTAGQDAPGISQALPAAGLISGTVTDNAATPAPLASAFVTVFDQRGLIVASSATQTDGTYVIGGLQDGVYRVRFEPPFGRPDLATQFWHGKPSLPTADPIAISAGTTASGTNAALATATGASISGLVRALEGGPLPNATVSLYSSTSTNPIGATFANADGSYTFSGLASGTYRVGFEASGRVAQFYNGKSSLALADPIAVGGAAGSPNAVNATLATAGAISGTVTDTAGNRLPGVQVTVFDGGGVIVGFAETGPRGTYTASPLAPGADEVEFSAPGFASQFYLDQPSIASANPVDVLAAQTTTGIGAALARAGTPASTGSIAGRVTDSAGRPLTNIDVVVYDASQNYVASTTTNTDGTYSVTAPPGTYRVRFSSNSVDPRNNYLAQFYMGAATFDAATPVAVTAGAATPGIDAGLAAGGLISGHVRDSRGNSLPNIEVSLYDANRNQIDSATTDRDGGYFFGGLAAGTYYAGFACCAFAETTAPRNTQSNGLNVLTQFYNGRSTLATADPIVVSLGNETAGKDATMQPGGRISGTVGDAAGPLDQIEVDLYDAAGKPIDSVRSATNGTYSFDGLDTGSYKVGFVDFSGTFAPIFYNQAPDLASAASVAVTAGALTRHVDATLRQAAGIAGTVTDAAGNPAGGVDVTVYDTTGSAVAFGATFFTDGTYRIGVSPGSYRVGFSPAAGSLDALPQFYNGKPDLGHADAVTVSSGVTASGIDAQLGRGGQITGTVTDTAGHALGDVTVTVYDPNGSFVTSLRTDSAGAYDALGLTAGTYTVGFDTGPSGANYLPQFYSRKPTLASATPVMVAVGATTPGIDAQLTAGGQIAGTVTESGGGPLGGVAVTVYDNSGHPLGTVTTAADGSYLETKLPAGQLLVGFTLSGFASQFFHGKPDLAHADPVTVTSGATSTGVDATLVAQLPTVTSIHPTSGRATGGTTVTITGTHLTGAAAVDFGTANAASNITVVDDSTVTASSPSGSGTVDVTVMTPAGTSAAGPGDRYTFLTGASIATAVSPASIALGASFHDTATLTVPVGQPAPTGTVDFSVFGNATCTGMPVFTSVGDPVSTIGGVTSASSGSFTPAGAGSYRAVASYRGDANYAAVASTCGDPAETAVVNAPRAPTVTALSPTGGPQAGGTSVTIAGANLAGATAVRFGATAASAFTVQSASAITATAPSGSGIVDVTVTTPGGTSAITAADEYTYAPPGPPVVASLSPASGPLDGGTGVVIFGSGFTGATLVTFGGVNASIVAANAAGTALTVLSPAGSGSVHVTVTSPQGTSTPSAADVFSYVVPPPVPALSGLAPSSGTTAGGTSVAIAGTNLSGATAVTFGARAATSFTVNSATLITAVAPPGTAGAVNVFVTTPAGTSPTAPAAAYTYVAPAGGTTGATIGTTGTPTLPQSQPTSQAGAPKVLSSSSVEFSATVNPGGLPTTAHFEYTAQTTATGASVAAIAYVATTPEQVVGSDFADHTVTATVTDLLPNSAYHFRAVATNSRGTTASGDATFKTATDPPPPPPMLGKTFNAEPVSGVVYVLLPGRGRVAQAHASLAKGVGFIPLTEARQLPVGTTFDATAGVARLTTATATKGTTQSGTFGAGLFKLLQNRKQRGLTELSLLTTTTARKSCATAGKLQATSAAKKALPKSILTLLRANAKGRFQTRGRYSSATVRGTTWTTSDRCDGTFTKVKRGVVVVDNLRNHRQIVLRAGKSYLARAP